MKNFFKKTVSILLVVVLIAGIMLAVPLTAQAASTNYYYKESVKGSAVYVSSLEEAWNEAAFYDGGVVGILADTTISSALETSNNYTLTLELNGHILSRGLTSYSAASIKGNVITVNRGATLNVYGNIKLRPWPVCENSYPCWYLEGDDNIKIKNGTSENRGVITGGYNVSSGGGIVISENATVNLNYTDVAGNRSSNDYYCGGGIDIRGENAVLNLKSSSVKYNCADFDGGGIAVSKKGKTASIVLDEKSSIEENIGCRNGGGIAVMASNCNVVSTSETGYTNIKGNSAPGLDTETGERNGAGSGGGIYIFESYCGITGSFRIYDNYAMNNGGGVYMNAPCSALNGCIIDNNIAVNGHGGGVCVNGFFKSDTCGLGNVVITNNDVCKKGHGDGVYATPLCNILLSGSVYIYGNDSTDTNENLYLAYSTTAQVREAYVIDHLSSDSAVFVTYGHMGKGKHSNHLTTSDCYESNVPYYFSDDSDYHFEYHNGYFLNQNNSFDGIIYRVAGAKPTPDPATILTERISNSSKEYNGYPVKKGIYSYVPTEVDDPMYEVLWEDGRWVTGTKGSLQGLSKVTKKTSGRIYASELEDKSAVFYYSDGYFMEDPKTYNTHLATLSACMANAAFNSNAGGLNAGNAEYRNKSQNIRQMMSDMGVKDEDIFVSDSYLKRPEKQSVGCCIGRKKLPDGKDLIIIAVRGGNYESEWAGNATLGSSGEHQGFSNAATYVFSSLEDYLSKRNINGSSSNTKFWIAGYSRAGATSNFTAKRIVDKYDNGGNRTFAYPIEPPKGGVESAKKSDCNYNCIHNVINYCDIVPWVAMGGLGFIRYGQDHFVPGTTASNSYTEGVPHDNYTLTLGSTGYQAQKARMLVQLKAMNPDLEYNDYFHTATLEYADAIAGAAKSASQSAGGFFGITFAAPLTGVLGVETGMMALTASIIMDCMDVGGTLIQETVADTPAEEWIPQFFDDFISYTVGYNGSNGAEARAKYASEKVLIADNKTFEQGLCDILGLVMGGGDQTEDFYDSVGNIPGAIIPSDISVKSIKKAINIPHLLELLLKVYGTYLNTDTINTSFTRTTFTHLFDKELWPLIRDEMKENGFTQEQLNNYKSSFKVVVYYMLDFVKQDYKKNGQRDLGTLVNCVTNLIQNHYPEVATSWIRSYDSFYNDETSEVEYGAKEKPHVPVVKVKSSITGEEKIYNGSATSDKATEITVYPDDIVSLVPGNSAYYDKGEAIYYQISNEADTSSNTAWHAFSYPTRMQDYYENDTYSGSDSKKRYKLNAFSTHYNMKSDGKSAVTASCKRDSSYLSSDSRYFVFKYIEDVPVGDYVYTYDKTNKYYRVTKYNGSDKNVIIPSSYNGASIGAIGDRAFSGKSSIKSITIPNTVQSIGEYAFLNCSNITELTIPDSVKSIGKHAFDNCLVTDLTVPGNNSFDYSNLPETVETLTVKGKTVKENAFKNFDSLTKVTLPPILFTKNILK